MRSRTIKGVALAAAAGAVAIALVVPAGAVPPPAGSPRNIIVFIGDGMGPEQVEIGRRVKGAPLFIDQIPWGATGSLNTDSLDGVTDSAAGATALATGFETHNGWLSMTPPEPGTVRQTVLERAELLGKASGLFSTGDLPDATPGAWVAHVTDRGEDEEVAAQMHAHAPEFLLGGRAGGAVAPLEGQPGVTYAKNLRELQSYAAGIGPGSRVRADGGADARLRDRSRGGGRRRQAPDDRPGHDGGDRRPGR